jgi:hypothetical protein
MAMSMEKKTMELNRKTK